MCEASSDNWVTSGDLECPGAGKEVRPCNTGPCVPDMMSLVPGARLLGGIVSSLSSIFEPMDREYMSLFQPQQKTSSPTQETQEQSCEYDCEGWPLQQCKVQY